MHVDTNWPLEVLLPHYELMGWVYRFMIITWSLSAAGLRLNESSETTFTAPLKIIHFPRIIFLVWKDGNMHVCALDRKYLNKL